MEDASPRFRQDLEATPIEAEGVACVDVRDPKTGTNFRFYDFEYQLALQLTGQPLAAVTAWASEAYGIDLTADGINEFAGRLSELGFLEAGAEAAPPAGATPAGESRPPESDSAEAEWNTVEGAQTATFVPDNAMLGEQELTPVAPELPSFDGDAKTPTPAAAGGDDATPPPDKARTAEMPAPLRLFDIPSPGGPAAPAPAPVAAAKPAAATIKPAPASEAPTAPALPAVQSAFAPGGGKPAAAWAVDLEGNLQPDADKVTPPPRTSALADVADTRTPPPLPTAPAAAVPPLPARATAVPPGVPERRQPPAPESVQMASFSEDAAIKPKPRGARIAIIVILLLAIAGIVYVAWTREHARLPQATRVRVFSPKPAAVYRWFSGRGTVTDHEARALGCESAGMLAELLPPGTAFAAGDILGRLRGAQPIEALLARQRARLAFYQQMRDSMRAANNQPELRQAEIKLAEKQRLIDETTASLAKLVVRAGEPGEVVETLAKVGMPVRAGAPLLRVKGRMLHGEFELDAEARAIAGKLGFCRVEVVGLGPHASNAEAPAAGGTAAGGTAADVGSPDAQATPRFIDCTFEKGAANKVRVALPDNLGLVPGQPLRLARERYEAVFPVPAAAVSGAGAGERRTVWVATAGGTAARREVSVVDVSEDALVSDGLRVGDEVIVEAPADLQPGALIVVAR